MLSAVFIPTKNVSVEGEKMRIVESLKFNFSSSLGFKMYQYNNLKYPVFCFIILYETQNPFVVFDLITQHHSCCLLFSTMNMKKIDDI